jgi:hypothetical protein
MAINAALARKCVIMLAPLLVQASKRYWTKLAFSSELRPFSCCNYTLGRLRVTSSVDCPGNYWLLFGGGLTCAGPDGGAFLGSDGPIDCGFLPLSQ